MDLLNIPINHFKFTIKGRETFKNKNQQGGNVVLKQRFSCKKYREKNNIKCRYSNTIHENKQSTCQESTS